MPIDPLVAALLSSLSLRLDSDPEARSSVAVDRLSAVLAAARAIPAPLSLWRVVVEVDGAQSYVTLGGTTIHRDEASQFARKRETPDPHPIDEPWLHDAIRGRVYRLERVADRPDVAAIRALTGALAAADGAR